jgi:tetratricopeptide (TPR) repeat protein
VPKRVVPIFRDRSDLEASADLGVRIRSGLENSQSLVVLCSPFAAASKWVNQEILTFKRLGRRDQVTPVLVSGEAVEHDPETAPNGAFPPALMCELDAEGRLSERRVPEPFAPDLREMHRDGSGGDGFELAKLKVVARLIDVPLAELTQRQAEVDRRDRRIITAVAVAMLLLAVVATAGGWFAWNKNLEAQARLRDAIDMAARQVDTATAYRDRYGVPGRVIQELLDSARRDFSNLINNVGETPRIRLQRARLALRFAELYQIVGDYDGRNDMLTRAGQDLEALETRKDGLFGAAIKKVGLVAPVSGETIARERLRYWDARATDAVLANQFDAALDATTAALNLAQRWAAAKGADTAWKRDLIKTHLLTAEVHYQAGNLPSSKASYQTAIEAILALEDAVSLPDLLKAYSNLATTVVELDERQAALDYQKRAAATAREILAADPENTDAKRTLGVALTRYGDMALAVDMNPGGALESYGEARELFEALVRADPLRVDWRRDRYILLERTGSAHLQLGNLEKADAQLAEAVAVLEGLLKVDPENLDWRRDKTVADERIGQLRIAQADRATSADARQRFLSQAAAALARAVEGREQLLQQTPEDVIAKHDLAMALLPLGTVRSRLPNQMSLALESFERALAIMAELTARPSAPPGWCRETAAIHVERGRSYARGGRMSEARSEFETAIAIIRRLRKMLPDVKQLEADERALAKLLGDSPR